MAGWRKIGAGTDDLGELIQRRSSGDVEGRDLSIYKDDIVAFAHEVMGLKPNPPRVPGLWAAQYEMLGAIAKGDRVAVQSANGMGKDHVCFEVVALWLVHVHGYLVIIMGPTARQLREVCMAYLHRAWARAGLPGEMYQMAHRLGPTDEAGVLAMTSTDPSKLTGIHASKMAVIFTEAQGVEPHAYEAAFAMAVGEHDKFVALGNPVAPSGPFWDITQSSKWHTIRISALDHPNWIEKREVIPGAMGVEGINRILDEYGEASPQYRTRVLGLFPETSAHGLIEAQWIDDAVQMWRTQDAQGWTGEPVYSVDVGRTNDPTVIAICQNDGVRSFHVMKPEVFGVSVNGAKRALRYSIQADEIERLHGMLGYTAGLPSDHPDMKLYRPTRWGGRRLVKSAPAEIIVDAPGIGYGLVEELQNRPANHNVTQFIGAESPSTVQERTGTGDGYKRRVKGPLDRFGNVRAEAAWRLRTLLERRQLPLPPSKKLREELLATEWFLDGRGRIMIEPKDNIKAKIRRSPDRMDTVCMLAWKIGAPPAPSLTWSTGRHRDAMSTHMAFINAGGRQH
jgi:hypothetical protein